jgi:hypothetical protein
MALQRPGAPPGLNLHEFRRGLDEAGLDSVRNALAMGAFKHEKLAVVRQWIAAREAQQADQAEAARVEREHAGLAVARQSAEAAKDSATSARAANDIATDANRHALEANEIARRAARAAARSERWAMYAVIASVIALAMSLKDQIKDLIQAVSP